MESESAEFTCVIVAKFTTGYRVAVEDFEVRKRAQSALFDALESLDAAGAATSRALRGAFIEATFRVTREGEVTLVSARNLP